jgi:predicted flap endonuclease-1-like 5' DNA nuclease
MLSIPWTEARRRSTSSTTSSAFTDLAALDTAAREDRLKKIKGLGRRCSATASKA